MLDEKPQHFVPLHVDAKLAAVGHDNATQTVTCVQTTMGPRWELKKIRRRGSDGHVDGRSRHVGHRACLTSLQEFDTATAT